MEFKAVCTADNQNSNGLHQVILSDSNGREVTFPSEVKFEKGEAYTVTIAGKGIDKPQPAAKALDKWDAQPETKQNESPSLPSARG